MRILKNIAVIKYSQRLGDVIRMLPLAKWYYNKGMIVFIDCFDQYADILETVSYCEQLPKGFKVDDPEVLLIDREIWPERYNAFRESGLKWAEFIYRPYPDIDPQNINFDLMDNFKIDDYQLKENFCLCFGIGASQIFQWPLQYVADMAEQWTDKYKFPVYHVVPPEYQKQFHDRGLLTIWAKRLADLPQLIKSANQVLTINTSASIIAGAVREKQYYHLAEPSFNYQDDHDHDLQIKIKPQI